jgi:hypothetical protein
VTQPIRVEGLRELQRAFKAADKTLQKDLRSGLRAAAEPVRASAETLAVEKITRIGVPWSRMRVGVTQREVYVAPRQRGQKGKDQRLRRPNLFDLLMGRALEPALDQNIDKVEAALEGVLGSVGRSWETG